MREQGKRIIDSSFALRTGLLLLLIWGVLMSFLLPPWQTPDEYTHLRMIGRSLGNEKLAECMMNDIELGQKRMRGQYAQKVERGEWLEAMTKVPDYSREDCLPRALSVSVIKHLPAALGILAGVMFHLPSFWVLELGELCSLLFYLAVCGLALRLMPLKKEVLLLFMGFPMAMQQASSINYDAVMLPLCYLFLAYLFYLRCEKERLGWKEAAITLVLLAWIVYIKLPYLFMGLLVLILPIDKIHLKLPRGEIDGPLIRTWRIPVGITLLLLVGVGLYLARGNFWIQLVCVMAQEWKQSAFLIWATLVNFKKMLFASSVGGFGWLDSQLPLWFAALTYLYVLFLSVSGSKEETNTAIRKRTMLYLWLIAVVLSLFVMLSMVNHTIKVAMLGGEHVAVDYDIREMIYCLPYIGGLQGRYFLPFLPLIFLSFPQKIRLKENIRSWMAVFYLAVLMIVSFFVLYQRYWV